MPKKQAYTFEQFKEEYEKLINKQPGSNMSYELREDLWKALEHKYPKLYAQYMLTTGFGALSEGSTVWVLIRKHGSGYGKAISVYTFVNDKQYGIRQASLTYHVANLLGYSVRDYKGYQVIWSDDYPQEFVAHLAQALFGYDKANKLRCEVL